MSERSKFDQFEMYVRAQRFAEAAAVLLEYCRVGSISQIEAVLATAFMYERGKLDFSKVSGPGRKSVENAIERLKTESQSAAHHDLDRRRQHNQSLKPKNAKDGRHRQRF